MNPKQRARSAQPTIEIKMRTQESLSGDGSWTWQCRLGTLWLTTPGTPSVAYSRSRGGAQTHGNRWLAALSEQLGVRCVPKWEEEKYPKPREIVPPGKVQHGDRCGHCGVLLIEADLPASCAACDNLYHV